MLKERMLMTENLNIMSKDLFIAEVERLVVGKSITYMEAIVLICEQNGLELETVNRLINGKIKSMLKNEAISLNLLNNRAKNILPV